jgi:hypothetical protein
MHEHESVVSPNHTHLITPVDSPLIWGSDEVSDEVSTESSEYNETPDVLPLGVQQQHMAATVPDHISTADVLHWGDSHQNPAPSPIFVGRATTETVNLAPRGNWFTRRYIQDMRNRSMPMIPASEASSSFQGSPPRLPRLNLGSCEEMLGSSVYSSFPQPYNKNTGNSSPKSLSGSRSQLTTYTPVTLREQAEFFPQPVEQSPPADDSAREAQLYTTPELSLTETDDVLSLNECDRRSASEVFFHGNASEDHVPALEAPGTQIEHIFEPRPRQYIFGSIGRARASVSEDKSEVVAALGDQTTDGESDHYEASGASLVNAVFIHHLQENTQRFRRESLMLRQLFQHAPEAVFRQGPESRVRVISNGASRFITGFDLFASEEQYGLICRASTPMSCSSLSKENTGEAVTADPDQVGITMPSPPTTGGFEYPFTPKAYKITVADAPTTADVTKCTTLSQDSPQNKQVTFARVRRAITVGGTISEEQEATYDQTGTNQETHGPAGVDLLAKWPDLKEDWHQNDQDFLHIGEHISDYEVSRKDRRREKATKFALNCLQTSLTSANTKLMNMTHLETSLASANTRLMNMESLERALELRHEGHVLATEQVAELSDQVSILKAKEASGKIVFDGIMADKLVERASKDNELETLRELCNNEPVAKELAVLHEALHESRHSKIEYLQHAEKALELVKRADDRLSLAEQQTQTAKIAQTFAEMKQQSAEEYHENLKERIVELESERDQAYEARDAALAEVERRQHAQSARNSGRAEPEVSTTPMGTPSGHHECHHDDVDEHETWDSGAESGGGFGVPTEGVTEELGEHDWDDSEIF